MSLSSVLTSHSWNTRLWAEAVGDEMAADKMVAAVESRGVNQTVKEELTGGLLGGSWKNVPRLCIAVQ